MLAELGGGTLLILGVATSIIAIALVPLILGTIYMVHGSKGWAFANEGGGWEFSGFLGGDVGGASVAGQRCLFLGSYAWHRMAIVM